MNKKLITEEKIYEIAIDEKKHHEERRDDINNQYISLFAAIIAVTPFINNLVDAVPGKYEGLVIRASITTLSLIGLTLAIIWLANLKRTLFFIEALDKIIFDLEKQYDIKFRIEIFKQLEKKGAPDRVTKYQLIIPKLFIIIFCTTILYSLTWLFIK